jgi:wobble nucleotide-excising tRNase
MSLHESLRRLREAAEDPQSNLSWKAGKVFVEDLKELLYHFDRIDNQMRDIYQENIQMRREISEGIESMEEYKDKITASKEEAEEALRKAGVYDETLQVPINTSSPNEPECK